MSIISEIYQPFSFSLCISGMRSFTSTLFLWLCASCIEHSSVDLSGFLKINFESVLFHRLLIDASRAVCCITVSFCALVPRTKPERF